MDIDRVINNLMKLQEGISAYDDTVDWLQSDMDTIKKKECSSCQRYK